MEDKEKKNMIRPLQWKLFAGNLTWNVKKKNEKNIPSLGYFGIHPGFLKLINTDRPNVYTVHWA